MLTKSQWGGGRNKIILMDNNILAHEHGIRQLEKIVEKGYRIDLNQGNSARLVDDSVAKIFAKIHWLTPIRFAADTPRQIAEVENAMALIDKYRDKPASYQIYTMIYGNIKDCYDRLSYFKKFPRVRLMAQPFRDLHNPNQVIPQWQKDMARWAMRRELYTSCDFKDFEPRKGFKCIEYLK